MTQDFELLQARACRLSAALRAWGDGRWAPDMTAALTGELRIVARLIESAADRLYEGTIRREVTRG